MAQVMTMMEVQVKQLVSKKKRRYIDDMFNLDLSCEYLVLSSVL